MDGKSTLLQVKKLLVVIVVIACLLPTCAYAHTLVDSTTRSKIVITGTGRSGTTFLTLLFTLLGYRTGYQPDTVTEGIWGCGGGLEITLMEGFRGDDIKLDVLKSPAYMLTMDQLADRFPIQYAIVPERDLRSSAISRQKCSAVDTVGGYFGENVASVDDQVRFYEQMYMKFRQDVLRLGIPVIYIDFEQMIRNCTYLYEVLGPVLSATDMGAAATGVVTTDVVPSSVSDSSGTELLPQCDGKVGTDDHALEHCTGIPADAFSTTNTHENHKSLLPPLLSLESFVTVCQRANELYLTSR